MPATCSYYRVGPNAETVCSRCARISRCPVGAAPRSFLLLPCQFPSPGYSPSCRGSGKPVKAVGKFQDGSSRAGFGQLPSDLPRLLGTIEPLQGLVQRRRHSVLPFGIQDSFFSARGTISPVPSIVRPREAPARMVGSEPLRTEQRRACPQKCESASNRDPPRFQSICLNGRLESSLGGIPIGADRDPP
jgi:hypothetical protein